MQLYPAELLYIRDEGIPLEMSREYVDFVTDRRVKLTRRGRVFYRAVCILHGLDPGSVDTLMSRESFDEIAMKVTAMRLAAKHKIDFAGFRGDLAQRAIDTFRKLTPEQMQVRIDCYERCVAAGPAVVLVDFLARRRLSAAPIVD